MVQVEYEEEDGPPAHSKPRVRTREPDDNRVAKPKPTSSILQAEPASLREGDEAETTNAADNEGLAATMHTDAEDEEGVASDDADDQEATVRKWRRILAMEDEGALMEQSVLSYEQHEAVCQAYGRTPHAPSCLAPPSVPMFPIGEFAGLLDATRSRLVARSKFPPHRSSPPT